MKLEDFAHLPIFDKKPDSSEDIQIREIAEFRIKHSDLLQLAYVIGLLKIERDVGEINYQDPVFHLLTSKYKKRTKNFPSETNPVNLSPIEYIAYYKRLRAITD